MANFYCEYCGSKFSSVKLLVSNTCRNHPLGACKGPHKLYEGSEKSQYICKYCGMKFPALSLLTGNICAHHPNGVCKGRHAAML